MTVLQAKAVLQRNYLFKGLPEDVIDVLASQAVRRTYKKGAIIFAQGDRGDALYGVASGRVRIGADGPNGQQIFLNVMEPGDVFGEIAIVDGLPRTAGATAIEDSVACVIHRANFLQVLHDEPSLAIHLLGLFCERLRWTSELVEDSAFLTGPARLAKRLLALSSPQGASRTADGRELLISQSELAHFLGISRQIVNQHLQDWRRNGWIRLGRSRITVTDSSALQNVVSNAGLSSYTPSSSSEIN
jgi:CRP-like cAMP-binding protein